MINHTCDWLELCSGIFSYICKYTQLFISYLQLIINWKHFHSGKFVQIASAKVSVTGIWLRLRNILDITVARWQNILHIRSLLLVVLVWVHALYDDTAFLGSIGRCLVGNDLYLLRGLIFGAVAIIALRRIELVDERCFIALPVSRLTVFLESRVSSVAFVIVIVSWNLSSSSHLILTPSKILYLFVTWVIFIFVGCLLDLRHRLICHILLALLFLALIRHLFLLALDFYFLDASLATCLDVVRICRVILVFGLVALGLLCKLLLFGVVPL